MSGVLARARQATHLQRRSRLTGERGFDAAFKHVACDELAQPAPIKIADRIGSQIAAVPHHRHPLGNSPSLRRAGD